MFMKIKVDHAQNYLLSIVKDKVISDVNIETFLKYKVVCTENNMKPEYIKKKK